MSAWDTFFMLLMVIPTAKMLSSIFMKLVSRIGTVDEDKWATVGLGGIISVATIASKALQGKGAPNKTNSGNSSNGGSSSGGSSSPMADMLSHAGDISQKTGAIGGMVGAFSPVAGPVVAGIMAGATKAIVNPVATVGTIGYGIGKRTGELKSSGINMRDALSDSVKEITGASTTSEASARIIGSVLGSPFGAAGANFGNTAAGWANKTLSKKSTP